MKTFYVYALYDPTTEVVFYIGKGCGDRDRSHLKPSMWKTPKETCNPFLYFKIKKLMEQNTPPVIKRIHEDLTEQKAYEIEHELIMKYGRRFSSDDGLLFNISDYKGGSNKGQNKPWTEERKEKHKKINKTKRIYDPSYDLLYEDYVIKGKTRKKIAEENRCSEVLVKKRLEHYEIIKPKEKIYPEKRKHMCIKCNVIFYTPNSVKHRKYCSRQCMKDFKNDQK